MTPVLVVPGVLAVVLGAVVARVRWPIRERLAVPLLTLVLVSTAAAWVMVVAAAAGGFVVQESLLGAFIGWCPLVPSHADVSWMIGVPAVVVSVWMASRTRATLRRRRWAREGTAGESLQVLRTDEPIAYAAPGRPGCVVVSTGMLSALRPAERLVMFAHERAHLEGRHHRYLLASELSVAVLPALRSLGEQVSLATERDADERAAVAVSGDRGLVASAIARAAVAKTSYAPMGAQFTGASVVSRVEALVGEPASSTSFAFGAAAGAVVVLSTLLASSVQLHHLAELVTHVCGG